MRACPVSSNYVYVRNQADVIYWRYEHATIGYLVYKSSLGTTLRDLLTKTKTTLPPRLIPTVIYEIYCCDCTVTYNRLTYRPLSIIKRIEEHKGHSRLDLHNPIDFTNTQFGLVYKIPYRRAPRLAYRLHRPSASREQRYLAYKIWSCPPFTDF